jgi:peptide/nickel transport system permease protein
LRDYVIRRVLLIIPSILVLTVFVFVMVRLIPGDVVDIIAQISGRSEVLTPEVKAQIREQLGLDKPVYIQYFIWLGDVLQGDLGRSLHTREPVLESIRMRFPVTLELVLLELVFVVIIGLSIGIISAARQDTWTDYLLRVFAITGLSVPFFWTAVLLLLFGSLWFNWIPPYGYNPVFEDPWGNLQQFLPAAIILAVAQGSQVARMTRATVLEVLRQDYIRTARAKGLPEPVVLNRHALKNALIPVVGLIGINFAFALGGTVILEQIFTLPGMGQLMISAIKTRDYPVIQGIILVIGIMVMIVNLLVDLSYGWLNPRIRYR